MKTLLLAVLAPCVGFLAACGDDTSGSTDDTTSTTGTTTGGSPTSSSSGGGGDGGSSVSTNSGGGGDGGAGSTSTGTGGAPPGCELVNGEAITGTDCAIFVNNEYTGDESGTRDAPYTTITQAVVAAAASGKSIYVCDGQISAYDEAVDIADSVSLVGGFGCSSWIWTEAGRTEWTAGADQIPLKVTAGASVNVANFAITAADAAVVGGSSIGVLVGDSTLLLARTDVTAGDGAAGLSGEQEDRAPRADSGARGNDGCSDDPMAGLMVEGGQNTCGTDRSGGFSGAGTTGLNGIAGSPGEPEGATNVGGARQTQANVCTNGGPGSSGTDGSDGLGAEELGVLSSSGFSPAAGLPGTPGTPASGGGGGGGAHECEDGRIGPSGGSGGAGGCGGNVGTPGGGGGASIAIGLVNATATFTNVSLFVGTGGRGGNGAAGQPGQLGGARGDQGTGDAAAAACPGGPGGNGGNGGSAGGGRGGHAVGVAWVGGGVPDTGTVVFADAGQPGVGGDRVDGAPEGSGDGGIADDVLELQ